MSSCGGHSAREAVKHGQLPMIKLSPKIRMPLAVVEKMLGEVPAGESIGLMEAA